MCSIMGVCGSGYTKDFTKAQFEECFGRTLSRGPDMSRVIETELGLLAFHRLAIMDLSETGMQPFERDGNALVCNGEIYGFRKIKEELEKKYRFCGDSDCEILLPMYEEYGLEMFRMLDAEFALILFDGKRKRYIAARDPIGIRPLFYGYTKSGTILFASDLDNTLLFSHRHRQPEDRCVERLNGAEQGFFTRETPDLLPQVVQRVHLLPITTRSIEQYQRIQWPDGTAPRIALTANGAVLLRDGQVDRAWYAASQALVRDHREALAAVLDHLTRQGGATSVRCVEGVYVYAAYPDIPAAERVARDWCGGSALQAVVSGRKVYFFPPGIDKGTALRRAVERFGPERVIVAGDSVIDVPMLRQADLALIPDAELLPRLPRERTRVCGRDCRFPDFVLKNVLHYAASLENT